MDIAREALSKGVPESAAALAARAREALLRPIVNATGVLLHTNLGRAPVSFAQDATYVNLEIDMATGQRGSRLAHAGALLARACGAEGALVVNNGAGAMLLVLAALARNQGVAVSRGELIEIGGGFRLPDVMAESGARLIEVGTTNRTRLADYTAVAREAALILKVHASNYRIVGFTSDASVGELATVGPPVLVDLGSGLLDSACPWLPHGPPAWLEHEPAARQTLAAGAAITVFSGDKLLGGPQAGIIAGRAELVASCARHPLYRALRPGALLLRALQEVALAYLDRTADELPFWRMATESVYALRARAEAIVASSTTPCVSTPTTSLAGGGSAPGFDIPSWGIALEGDRLPDLRRSQPRPVIARVRDGRTILDLRTIEPGEDEYVQTALCAAY
ncbi:MAG: L-seryl-tRNA(Sec) selenium transferase [Acidimicrobiia bacterium]